MGGLDSAARRVQPLKANQSSLKLTALANALPKSDAVDEYVAREIARAELTIGKPPTLPDVSAIRELLLRETVVWDQLDEIGSVEATARRTMQMTTARSLVANALAKAGSNDTAAWEELHAVWNLARSLEGHSQMMAQTAAFSMARMINAVGWKMPLPPPAWFAEVQAHDSVPPLLEAFQHQTASYWQDGAHLFPTAWLARDVDHDRQIAEELVGTTKCDVNMRMNKLGTDLSFVWRRAFRYRAEREATANAIRIREGKPIESKSVCSDGGWTVDGTTLRFSREIATAAPDRPMPLVLQVKTP
jgi:hypothetical protein